MVVKLTKDENSVAAIRMVNSIAVVRTLSTSTSYSTFSVKRAAQQREEEGARGADARAFGGGEHAAVDAAQHHHHQQRHAPDVAQRAQALGPGGALGRRPGRRGRAR